MRNPFAIIAGALLFAATTSQAQFTGKGSQPESVTVKYIQENAYKLDKADALVKVKGFVTEQIKSDLFWFTDGKDRIQIEISKKYMPATPFNETTEVIITGKVDHDLLEETDIEVKEIVFPNNNK